MKDKLPEASSEVHESQCEQQHFLSLHALEAHQHNVRHFLHFHMSQPTLLDEQVDRQA